MILDRLDNAGIIKAEYKLDFVKQRNMENMKSTDIFAGMENTVPL